MEVMTIDSLNGLRGASGTRFPAFAADMNPEQDFSSWTVSRAQELVDRLYAAPVDWDHDLALALPDVPEPSLRGRRLDLLTALMGRLEIVSLELSGSNGSATLNAQQAADLRSSLRAAKDLHAEYVRLVARYGPSYEAGDLVGLLTLVAGVGGIYLFLRRRRRR